MIAILVYSEMQLNILIRERRDQTDGPDPQSSPRVPHYALSPE